MEFKKIGVENFRVFKDYTEFEIRPITLLTGPNNSGKSSFTKLLLLLNNTLNHLDFGKGKHNLVDYDQILNWQSQDKSLKIDLGNTIPFLGNLYRTEIIYKEGKIVQIRIHSIEATLFQVNFDETSGEEMGIPPDDIQTVRININLLLEMIYGKEIQVDYFKHTPQEPRSSLEFNIVSTELVFAKLSEAELVEDGKEDFFLDTMKKVNIQNLRRLIKQKVTAPFDQGTTRVYRNLALGREIDSLKRDYLLYIIESPTVNFTEEYPDLLKSMQEEIFQNLNFDFNYGSFINYENKAEVIEDLVERINYRVKAEIIKRISNQFEIKKEILKISESKIGMLLFKEKLFDDNVEKGIYFQKTLFELFTKVSFSLKNYLNQLNYISPNRGNQKRILMNKSETEIDQIVLEYFKTKNKRLAYLKEIFSVLDIEGELIVDRHENYISVVSLVRDNKKITLHDLGYGYSQILPIILKIIVIMNNGPQDQNLIIEEPEANLHPNLQSKIADVLSITLKYFPKLKMIVETHSEYLIRKLQYLTAKNELQPEQSIIFYFNADKYVSRDEPKVKKIEITPTGNLTDTFGPGFYDEATQLKFDLMNINKKQNN